jgi:predicted nucleic acid-binding protein
MKIGSNSRKIYWDTSVLIAWLKDERHWPSDVLTGIQDAVYEVENYNAILFTSSITRTEFFTGQLTDEQKTKYTLLMRRSNVQEVDPHLKITTRASQIREHYSQQKPSIKIKTPDAIHLATAINYRADEFQTLDGLEDGGAKKTKLLALSGDVGVSGLKITAPYPRARVPANLVAIKGPLFGQNDEQTIKQAEPQTVEVRGSGSGHPEGETSIQRVQDAAANEGQTTEEIATPDKPKAAGNGGP